MDDIRQKFGLCVVPAFMALSAVGAGSANAQTTDSALRGAQGSTVDFFVRDRSTAVRERPHPGFEAIGIPVGTFTAYPKLQVESEFSDNVFAVTTGEDDDLIFRIKPEISLDSSWSRHALRAYARGSFNRYNDFSSENSDNLAVGASGQLDVDRTTSIRAGVDASSYTESRTSANTPTFAAEPVEFDLTNANVSATRTAGRIRLSGRADTHVYDYKDTVDINGVNIDQDFRDRTISSVSGRLDYAVSPGTAVFFQATGNDRNYDEASTALVAARDSTGYEALAGVNFELGALTRGEIAVGYIAQEFDDPAYDNVNGLGARAQLEWFPTQLTTVTLTGARTVEDSGVAGAGGYLSSSAGIQVDHELLRNVILTGQISYSANDYDTLDRSDERLGAAIGATYLVNRYLGVTVQANTYDQSSDGVNAGPDFRINKLSLSLVTQF